MNALDHVFPIYHMVAGCAFYTGGLFGAPMNQTSSDAAVYKTGLFSPLNFDVITIKHDFKQKYFKRKCVFVSVCSCVYVCVPMFLCVYA